MRLFLLALLLLPLFLAGQSDSKGDFYLFWGYNRGWYTNSDIHFKGDGYDFTLWDTPAHDSPEKFSADTYLNPKRFTIPQFNFRLGYFFHEKYSLSLGWDHMKYFMDENIFVNVSGYLNEDAHDRYSFDLDNEPFFLARDFMEYEHSDGFNYVRINLDRYDHLHSLGKFDLKWTTGIGVGAALTWSDHSWGSRRYRNKAHLSGFNLSINTGPQLEFKEHFFLNSTLMAGHAQLYDVQIRYGYEDKAEQHFQFIQWYTVLGYRFSLAKNAPNEKLK
ncbi:MAG: hypothetical protein AAF487_07945 [Bacteroidota bacterium]